ncbi:MAG TPA: BrnA antitoxin family protein [Burkholderiaceae bacterium]|nr:BrnA antitoxin family protein [Burkholderiaceae bacterium]
MSKEPDFSTAKRGPLKVPKGKTRVTIYLDDVVIEAFREQSERTGKGYQTLINEALQGMVSEAGEPLTAEVVRKIVREELEHHA